jgi:hypothetical protein
VGKSGVREAREKARVERAVRLEDTKRSVYRIPTGYGSSDAEIAQIHAAFRSARADVSTATEGASPYEAEQKLRGVMDQAERTDDSLLARPIVDRFLSTRKSDAQAWERYTEAAQEASQASGIETLLEGALTQRVFSAE